LGLAAPTKASSSSLPAVVENALVATLSPNELFLSPEATASILRAATCQTTTLTGAEVVWFPAASRARAVNVRVPLAVPWVFHAIEYGALVTSLPNGAPSRRNWTPTTPMLSVAVAETVTFVPDTWRPGAGAVSVEVGGVV